MAAPAVSLYQDSISSSLNAVIEQRTPQLMMPVLNQATSKTTPKKPKKRKPKIKENPEIKLEPTDWSAFDASANVYGQGCNDVPIKKIKQEKITDHLQKVKKKRDRFNGMPEEEVEKRLLPDHLAENLDIVIVGINPGLFAAYVGHHYAGPGNHFWKCLYLSGLIPEPMNAYDDSKLLEFGIGFTNICARTTRGSADLKRVEIKEGGTILREKLLKYRPKIAVFNGKGIYEIYCGHKKFSIGKQPDRLEGTDTIIYVMPSSSARCAQLPRAEDKVPFYEALRKLRDHVLMGTLQDLDEAEVTFPKLELKIKKEEPIDNGYIKAEQGMEGTDGAPKPKPKKKRNRKSVEATVTSGEITSPYSGEVIHPFSTSPSHSGQIVPFIKQEQTDGTNQYGSSVTCANNFPFVTQGVTVPSSMPSQYAMSQSYPQAPFHFPLHSPFMPQPTAFSPPSTTYNPTSTTFNPPLSQIPNYTQHQIAHMDNNGFLPNMQPCPLNWNPYNPNSNPISHPNSLQNSNQYYPNMTEAINNNGPQVPVSEASKQVLTGENSSMPFIKSEPVDSSYKAYDLTVL